MEGQQQTNNIPPLSETAFISVSNAAISQQQSNNQTKEASATAISGEQPADLANVTSIFNFSPSHFNTIKF